MTEFTEESAMLFAESINKLIDIGTISILMPEWLAKSKGCTRVTMGIIKQDREKAILFKCLNGFTFWLPKSQIKINPSTEECLIATGRKEELINYRQYMRSAKGDEQNGI
jgi:hypothetical protein